jgi:hypothetical protein
MGDLRTRLSHEILAREETERCLEQILDERGGDEYYTSYVRASGKLKAIHEIMNPSSQYLFMDSSRDQLDDIGDIIGEDIRCDLVQTRLWIELKKTRDMMRDQLDVIVDSILILGAGEVSESIKVVIKKLNSVNSVGCA